MANHFNLITKHFSTWKVWTAILFFKLLFAYFLPFSFDEAYYWVWSHHLQLSYFDHPPMVAWLLSLGHLFEGFGYLARLPIVIVGQITLVIWVFILREITQKTDSMKEALFLLIGSSCLFLGMGSIVATPDVPLNLFWSLSLLFLLKLLRTEDNRYAWLLGLALGLGFLSKYHIVLLPATLVIGLLIKKRFDLLKLRWLAKIIVAGFLACLPVLVWNYQNDWISFKFQLNHGLQSEIKDPKWILEYLLGQILFIGPATLFLFFKKPSHPEISRWILFSTSFGVLFFFLVTSFRAPVEPNWPIMAYFSIFLIVFLEQKLKPQLIQASIYAAILLVALGLLSSPRYQLKLGKLSEPFEYKVLVQELQNYSPLYASRYQMASVLWFELKRPVYKVPEISRYDFFESLHAKEAFPKKFYILIHDNKKLPQWLEAKQPIVSLVKKFHARLKLVEVQLP